MSIDKIYIEAAIETLDLNHQLINHLHENQQTDKMSQYISQIQTKADARISSSLGQSLGIQIPVDQEGKPTKYWEGVRDTAKLAKKQWITTQDLQKFLSFLTSTRTNLAKRIGIDDSSVNPLEDIISETPQQEVAKVAEPVNPLEEMLVSDPQQEPIVQKPVTPDLTPITQTPTPIVQEPAIPAPKPIAPTPVQPEPVYPDVSAPQPSDKLSALDDDKLSALDEALKSSGLEQAPVAPSLTDMLISDEDKSGDKEEEDDMLSMSLREALKILRDEDED